MNKTEHLVSARIFVYLAKRFKSTGGMLVEMPNSVLDNGGQNDDTPEAIKRVAGITIFSSKTITAI